MHESSKLGHIMYIKQIIEYVKEIEYIKQVTQKLYMYNISFNKICISIYDINI